MEGLRQDTRLTVERLQGQVARLRAGLWFTNLLLLGALGYLGWRHLHPKAAPPATVLHVRGLVVEDEAGTARVVLEGPGLRLLDGQGQSRAAIQVREDGALLSLNDRHGAPLFTAAGADQGASVAVANPKKDAVLLGAAQGPTLQIRRDGRTQFKQPWDAPDLK